MKIEELPSVSPSEKYADPVATLPALPQHMQEHRSKSTSKVLEELNSSPLFMTSLVENEATEALRALSYEGTAAEVAENFKEQGNECFKAKRWGDAKEFYGKAVDVLVGMRREQNKEVKEEPNHGERKEHDEDLQKEMGLLEACFVNRAACHLELKNYRCCTQDCAETLRLNPKNLKAFYRSSKAFLAVGRIDQADESIARGLSIDPGNNALRVLAVEILGENEEAEKKRQEEMARAELERREKFTLLGALRARGIRTRKTEKPPEMEDARIQLLPDPVDPTSELSFPTILLYPLHLESDFVKSFKETETLGSHLEYILPVPWDGTGEYTLQGVDGYMETIEGGLVKVGKKVSLLKVLTSAKVEVVDEVVRIYVVPKLKADAWIRDFKMK